MSVLYAGAVAAEVYALNVAPSDFPGLPAIDLSTVTAASLDVKKPSGATTTWAATRSNQTISTLKLTHAFPAAPTPSELDEVGAYSVVAVVTVPGGTLRSKPFALLVKEKFNLQ